MITTDINEVLEEVERLDREATAGPWGWGPYAVHVHGCEDEPHLVAFDRTTDFPTSETLDLITAYRSAAPFLAAAVKSLRADVEDERKSANIHRRLNERVASALGLLDVHTDPETGEEYLPSWHDMPERVAALARERDEARATIECLTGDVAMMRARLVEAEAWADGDGDLAPRAGSRAATRMELDRVKTERDEARLALAAEQGRIEGASSEHWTPIRAADGSLTAWHNKQTGAVVEAYIDRLSATDVRFARWRWRTRSGRKGRADNARAAMLAADGCAP